MRRHHPKAAWDVACDAASERKDELAFAVPMGGYLRSGLGDVNAHGNRRRGRVIHIEVEPRIAEGLSHD
jgi:hypothetical protein